MACISGDFERKTKFDVALHFTKYLRQFSCDFQNLKSGMLSRACPISIYGNYVSTYVLSSLLEPDRITYVPTCSAAKRLMIAYDKLTYYKHWSSTIV